MGHLTVRSAYKNLVDRLNQFPQGAPPSDTLYKILKLLISENEAEFISKLSIRPFTAKKAAALTNKKLHEAERILENLAERGLLLDIENNGITTYTLPPPMAGFFEFALMRLRNDIDQKLLAELFYQYLNIEEDFVKDLFWGGDTKLGRAFVNEAALTKGGSLEVLDYERASEIVKTATHVAVGLCYCRHKMEHAGKACKAPMEICMTFNNVAASLIDHKIAREIDADEGLDLLQLASEKNLVQLGDNVKEKVSFICNCCGCCCEALVAAKNFGFLIPVQTTNFIPKLNASECNGCGRCVKVCPIDALELVPVKNGSEIQIGSDRVRKTASLSEDICLGCGLCVKSCNFNAIVLVQRKNRVITPVNSVHRVVMMAIERGKLQNLIFDKQALWNHRAMAAILGVILKLPPVKRALASEQFKSKYLEFMIRKFQIN